MILVYTSVIVPRLDLNLPHLTNDRRRIKSFPEVDFVFVS